jgi:chromate transporter
MIYLELFWSFIQIGFFSIGGGLASLPLIQSQIVENHGWLTYTEFADIITVSEMTPGPIAINAATFVGARVGGAAGAVTATVGFLIPTLLITFAVSYLYTKYKKFNRVRGILSGLRPGVIGLIANAGATIFLFAFFRNGVMSADINDIYFFSLILFAACLFVLRKYRVHPILIIALSGAAGGIYYSLFGF